ncbi:MAG: class I SAM-dependent methyltransferase [Anaerolineae bacterium]
MTAGKVYREQVKQAILDEKTFLKATFSGRRRGYELPWRRVTVRPVLIQGERHLQVSHLDETQDTTQNYVGREAEDKIDDLLGLPFSQIHVVTTQGDIQVQISRKGVARVHRHAASEPRPGPMLAHDRRKRRPLSADQPDPLLRALDIQTEDGQIRTGKRRKFRQINEFLRLILESGELEALEPPIRIVDCGCGSADLTFAVYHYLNHVLDLPTEAVGIDVKEELLTAQNSLAQELGWVGLRFVVSRIIDYEPEVQPTVVLALHACDTATDEALAQAVRWGAQLIFSAPCCHHHLQAQMADRPMPPVFQPVLRHGILKERVGDVLTDSFRAQILRILGYRTDVVEFISPEHTDKNLMIRAVKTSVPGDPKMVEAYMDLVSFWQVEPYLAQLLKIQLAEAGVSP